MAFYENTIVAKQDLVEKDLKTLKDKYNEIINKSSIQEILSYYMEIDKDKILNTINIYNGLNMVISIEQLNEYNNIFKNFMR